ncbi:MAG: PAS domain-containing sensor histidine kinase, partial [Betaproteobacteria bacterium]|nr:PAS domain-containing sensor histidine kinase [Betaproteobacteria bacterium]
MALLPAGDLLSRDSRTMRWAVLVGAAAMVLIGVVLMLLLTVATNNRQLYEQHYGNLFAINLAMAALLLLVILFIAVRLLVRLRRKRFGSRLLVKLAAVFALVGFVPGMLIYTVSYQFVSRSIESWFDVRVEGALDAGLTLGRSTLDTLSLDLSSRARAAAGLLNPARPSPQQMRNARSQRVIAWVDGLEESGDNPSRGARVRALALVPSSSVGLTSEPRFLQLSQELPPTLVGNLVAVATAHREYQERALARDGLRRMYIGTLTLSLFLAVFGAVLLAVLLGTQIARPLLVL